MRALFIGDIVGESGRRVVIENIQKLRDNYNLDFVIANGENSASGFGITEKILHSLIDSGVDVVTTGNHIWDQKETLVYIERNNCLLRPANFPNGTPGKGFFVFNAKNGEKILVINLMGRVFMNPLDDPFKIIDEILSQTNLQNSVDAIFVDFHAEATSEKLAMGYYLDGRVSMVVGTHTHVPTADSRILSNGTGYISDVGMSGDYDSILGFKKQNPLEKFITSIPSGRFIPASGEATLSGILFETNNSGLLNKIRPIRLGGLLGEELPEF
ncbi:MAG: TIGR00282 family metallophosphoesterase [Hyphomicrobiales bacterium]|jgi:metallophosphoesterase (TIGR00282 family)